METAPLKSFATWARTALLREVSARISVVLASEELRQEQPNAVAALEKAVNAAGSGDKGRDAVADKVAYTWFNRIIALRFMDANGYTGIGIVSPERGREGGQPEVLAEAKRGNIDSTVVTNKRTTETITGLLNGMRRSDDPQGEAYALLLAEYCRYWNRSMPFMFEREGDYTELLIPANLLADDSVLARAVDVLTEEVCQDVEVIGWLYQFYISERKDEVFAGFKKNKKAGADEIPAATQLFTPHWIVRYLVENSLGRLWLLNRPTSRLAQQMDYYVAPVNAETEHLKVDSPEELKIIDPACGSGHMLTYAFDLLYSIYEEEGYAPSDIPTLILTNNLYGTEIDPRAGALAAFALTMKARARQRTFFNKQVEPNICVLESISFTPAELNNLVTNGGDRRAEETFFNQFEHADTFGSLIRPRQELIEPLRRRMAATSPGNGDLFHNEVRERAQRVLTQAEYLSTRYHVTVANPPYMGSKNMSAQSTAWLAINYPASRFDLMTAYMERAESLSVTSGLWGMINLPSWLFLTSFEQLRQSLLQSSTIESLLHLGRGVFGSDFGSVAFIVSRRAPHASHKGIYRRLFQDHVDVRPLDTIKKLFLDPTYGLYLLNQSVFSEIPRVPIVYWLEPQMLAALGSTPRLASLADARQGLSPADKPRFMRYWWEVSVRKTSLRGTGAKWVLYNKGGAYRKWFGNVLHVIDWANDGAAIKAFDRAVIRNPSYYFRPSLSWTKISSGKPSFRFVPDGTIFDGAAGSLFPHEPSQSEQLLGFLNSNPIRVVLEAYSPTVNYTEGDISQLPVPRLLGDNEWKALVCNLIQLSSDDWNGDEESSGFTIFPGIPERDAQTKLAAVCAQELHVAENRAVEMSHYETVNNRTSAEVLGNGLDHYALAVEPEEVGLRFNPYQLASDKRASVHAREFCERLASFAVGCMFGRYSLDEPGLILANQGDTLQDYLAQVPSPTFGPDNDNVIPIVDGDWFEDDILARFRQFLRAAFGDEHFEDNLRFVTEALGVKDLRDYFVKSFYKDHLQRYKKRPIYWLFSSPKGSFNALIYMHRYTPSTASTVLNEYLREFKAKLDASRQHHERLAVGTGAPRQQAAAQKEVDRLRKILLELDEYEHDVLYPLATQQVQIDLDEGVKANYPKLGAALKKIPGLEASDE
ncbi:BREX-1 system adenine-specific DNA-methyltransferase PglX [Pseudarthrobacter sp. NPDC080039]|uniref:BREX-1 system adenine-specific DNA-methyltransferase PglX n=1 Tax=unclassified Pseudarthrobacter TaxID=2647000 RepID=UPI00344C053B